MGLLSKEMMAHWPPRAWPALEDVHDHTAQSMVKHIDQGRVSGLTYHVQTEQVYVREKVRLLYFIQIDGWEYSIRNDSHEYPLLSYAILDGISTTSPDQTIQNIYILAKPLNRGYRLADKVVRASTHIMRQVQYGQVPDVLRVLSAYQLITPAMRAGNAYELCRQTMAGSAARAQG